MASSMQSETTFASASLAVAERPMSFPWIVVLGLVALGLISPLFCFAGAALALLMGDSEQGILLSGAALVHLVLGMTLLAGF